MYLLAQITSTAPNYWPFAVLLICIALIVFLITVVRMHAFLALTLAAIAAGLLSGAGTLPGEPLQGHWVQAVELTTEAFGTTAGKVALVIALASVISMCLMESGAADKVVRRFLAVFGEKRAGAAIVFSGYLLSIPIFFDTFFMLLLPLARAMAFRTGKNYLLYVLAICCGASVTHSLIVPHPGPLAMAEALDIDVGVTIMAGTLVGLIPVAISWVVAKWICQRLEIPLRESPTSSTEDLQAIVDKPESELPSFTWSILPVLLPIVLISVASTFAAIQGRGFATADVADANRLAATLKEGSNGVAAWVREGLKAETQTQLQAWPADQPVTGPLQTALVDGLNGRLRQGVIYEEARFAGVSLRPETSTLMAQDPAGKNLVRLNRMLIEDAMGGALTVRTGMSPTLFTCGDFLGNRNVALIIGTVLAMIVLVRQRRWTLKIVAEKVAPALETAGVIILITSAGGAFGLMLRNAGVGEAVKVVAEGRDINLILLSWVVAAVIRVAQGSATVSMLTAAAMVAPLLGPDLPYHPVYIFMSIGFGALTLSWMNDSGFWVVCKLSGFTEKETLKSWTVIATTNSVVGVLTCLVLSKIIPHPFG